MTSLPHRLSVLLLAAWLPAWGALAAGPAPSMLGFAAQGADAETALEGRFDALLDARDMRAWLERMSSAPNHVGSPHDKANAEFMLEQFRAWGWDATLETFEVLYPTPRRVALDLVAPHGYHASLVEPPIPGDRTSAHTAGALPPYNVYGADGDVTAELVYVNYGMPDDYRELSRRGISVKGRIVIARYGAGWRGLKPKLAWQHGAIGCIIYSDPRDDGYGAADTYPAGAGRPAGSVQRGSVADMPIYSGDPLTPGIGATRDAPRLDRSAAATLLKIPVLPISYADARPLLEALRGTPGQARAELLPKMFGPELVKAFEEFKGIWDPNNRMNPGKIVKPRGMMDDLRMPPPPSTATHFAYPENHGGFSRAVALCVGVGKCRKEEG